MKSQVQQKTLKDVIDEIAERNRLSGTYDFLARFDGKRYSLLNLRNYLDAWKNSPAYMTAGGNIKFIPHDGDGTAATILLEKKEKEA